MRRGPRLGRVLGALAAAAAVAGASIVVGLDPVHAVALGAGALVVLVLLTGGSQVEDLREADEPDRPPGGRADVEETAWALIDREGRVRFRILDRLRRVADRDPGVAIAAREVLRQDRRPPTLAELDRALRRVEQE